MVGTVYKNQLQKLPAGFTDIVEPIAVFFGPITRALAAVIVFRSHRMHRDLGAKAQMTDEKYLFLPTYDTYNRC